MAAPESPIALYVRCVPGRAVHRWGSADPDAMIGCRRLRPTKDERQAGAPTLVWDERVVVPVAEATERRFRREIVNALRRGDVVEVNEAAYKAWLALEAAESKRDAEAAAKREAEAKAAQAKAEAEAKKATAGGKTEKSTEG